MPDRPFQDRRHAGRVLADLLEHYRNRDVVVLALPRGGVPVAHEVAAALGAPLDVLLVRKLGLPAHPELAMGALAGGTVVINNDVVRGHDVPLEVIREVAQAEARELARQERAYREGRPMADVSGKIVILVDDGLATGASMRAAVQAVRRMRPERLVVAIPAAPRPAVVNLGQQVDEVVCAAIPDPFYAVGAAYRRFSQTTDREVRNLLRTGAHDSLA